MREAIWNQPALLAELLRDQAPVAPAAERLRGRRVYLVGTGTSWHAAAIGATWLLAVFFKVRAYPNAPANIMDIELGGLYWHFVDLVWVFIFAFFYLW